MKNVAVLGLLCLTLTGCWTNNASRGVSLVKGSTYEGIQNGITIGEALENREICKQAIWTDEISDNGDPIVEYRCELVDYKSFYTNVNKQHLNDKLAHVQENRDNAIRMMYMGQDMLRELEYRRVQFNVLEQAIYALKNQGIPKEYVKVGKSLGINKIDYRFIFDQRREYKVTNWNSKKQIKFKQLQAQIKEGLLKYGLDENYYDVIGLNLAFEQDKDILNLNERDTVYYFARAYNDIYRRSEDIRKEVETHKNTISKLKFANAVVDDFVPKKIEQVIKFNIITGRPVTDYCTFEINYVPVTNEYSSIHTDYCLKMAYDKVYNESFKQLFIEDFENKLAHSY